MSFDWSRKRNVQIMTPNRVIQTIQLSPKEVIESGGNRVHQDQVIASLCVAVTELMRINEDAAARIDALTNRLKGTDNERVPAGTPEHAADPNQ